MGTQKLTNVFSNNNNNNNNTSEFIRHFLYGLLMQQLTNYQELLNCHSFAALTTELFIILYFSVVTFLHKAMTVGDI